MLTCREAMNAGWLEQRPLFIRYLTAALHIKNWKYQKKR